MCTKKLFETHEVSSCSSSCLYATQLEAGKKFTVQAPTPSSSTTESQQQGSGSGALTPMLLEVVIGWEREYYIVEESSPRVELCAVVFNGTVYEDITVSFFYGEGNATGRVDFPPEMNTQLIFSPTLNRTCIDVAVFDDNEVEETEVFEVSLSSTFDYITLLPSTAIVVILDNDQVTTSEPATPTSSEQNTEPPTTSATTISSPTGTTTDDIPSPSVTLIRPLGPTYPNVAAMFGCSSLLPEVYRDMENASSISLETYWNISYSDQEEIIPVTNFTSTSTASLTYTFTLLGRAIISCYSQVQTGNGSSDVAIDSVQLQVVAPPVNLTTDPSASIITVADVPPFNQYTIACTANLLPELQIFTVNLSWFDVFTGQPILQNDSIRIQTFATTMVLDGGAVVVYSSVLMASEMASGNYSRLCRADVTFMGTQAGTTYPGVATSSKIVIVNGRSSPAPIEDFGVYGVSFELAVIEWTVPRIAYTPETYRVVYQRVGDSEESFSSEMVMGTTSLSAVNTQYSVVITNLQPNSMYTFNILASNVGVTRFTRNSSFATIDSGIYAISDDLPTVFPVGSQVNIAFVNVQLSHQLGLYSLSQKRLLVPDSIQYNAETRSVLVSFAQAAPSLSGDHILCGSTSIPDSQRQRRTSMSDAMQCGRRINISITVPTLRISTQLLVLEYMGSFLISDTSPSVTCLPSDLRAPVRWREINLPSLPAELEAVLTPRGVNHTITFPRAFTLSPAPSSNYILECDLINPDLQSTIAVAPQYVWVRFLQGSISILNDVGTSILPQNAVINYFDSNPVSPFHIRCFGAVGNTNLQWESRNVSVLDNGEITEQEAASINGLFVVYINTLPAFSFSFNRSTIVLGIPSFQPPFAGYYTCRSRESNRSVEVYMTPINPLWQFATPSSVTVPMGADVIISLQYGDDSVGSRNNGRGFLHTLIFLPCVAALPDLLLQSGATDTFNNLLTHSFTARLEDSGEYRWNATHLDSGDQYLASSNISVIRPHLMEFDTVVYTLLNAIVTLRCQPNDTRAPILWQQSSLTDLTLNPDLYTVSPEGLGHIITFNSTIVYFPAEGRRLPPQSILPSTSTFTCRFINGNDRRNGSQFFHVTNLMFQRYRIEMSHRVNSLNILNNTVVNRFMFLPRKREASSDYVYEAPEVADYPGQFLSVLCSGVQGDHSVIWLTDNTAVGDNRGIVNCDERPNNQQLLSNYSSQLQLNNLGQIVEGNYSCRSQISGIFQTFQISFENPFIRRLTPATVRAENGEAVRLSFLVAVNSDGSQWSTSMTSFSFTNSAGQTRPVNFTADNADYPQLYSLLIEAVDESHAGTYRVTVPDQRCDTESEIDIDCPSLVVVSTTVEVVSFCEEEVADGVLWPRTSERTVSRFSCSRISDSFRGETQASRQCVDGGRWADPDLTTCTLRDSAEPFLLLWFIIEANTSDQVMMSPLVGVDGGLNSVARTFFEQQMENLLDTFAIPFLSVNVASSYISSVSLVFEVTLHQAISQQLDTLSNFSSHYQTSFSTFGGFEVREGNRGYRGFTSASSCFCRSQQLRPSEESLFVLLPLCAGVPSSPCTCAGDVCQCVPPFAGDGMSCTVDTDGDSFPDVALTSESCNANSAPPNYCTQDNCPLVPNLDQNPSACIPLGPEFDGCPFGTDPDWRIIWPNTPRSTTSTQRCPGGLESFGSATRECNEYGVWASPNILFCQSVQFTNILIEATEALSSEDREEQLQASIAYTSQLVDATSGRSSSLLPADLWVANVVMDQVVSIQEENIRQSEPIVANLDENVINVFNNILDVNNTLAWNGLLTRESMNGSELLLNSAERYGMVIAKSQQASVPPRRLSRPNIALSASMYNGLSQLSAEALQFPKPEDLVNYTSEVQPVVATIPPQLIEERSKLQDSDSTGVPVVHIIFKNLEDFLPVGLQGTNKSLDGVSAIFSTQIGDSASSQQRSQVLENEPLSLEFTFDEVENASNFTCAFWQFSQPIGSGSFVSTGVITDNNSTIDGITRVRCLSTHTTSFAVLVDTGGLQDEAISNQELQALQIVSYIGCAISIICLTISVIFFLSQGKRLFDSVNHFIHLNLSFTLLCAFLVFVFGIELGRSTTGGCLFVALLLHYLFLSAFCWMLCEGILLYLLLVVVFSRLSKQWWFFMLIGYVSPIVIVVISVSVRHDYYGVRDTNGDLQYCWLSVEKGTIFAFVAPMLAIIIINVIFLLLGLHSLWKNKKKRARRKSNNDDKFATAKALFTASVVLLPLLGLTWVFGILTINANSTVFAWLFTIFNSFQGAAIFFFHVVRNDKVWSKVEARLTIVKRKTWNSESTIENSRVGTFKPKTTKTASYYMSTLSKVEKSDYTGDPISIKDDLEEHKEVTDHNQDSIVANPNFLLSEKAGGDELTGKAAHEKSDLTEENSDIVTNPAVESTKIHDESEDTNCTRL